MSEEDRAFLERVMSEGIIDEGERMKAILRELTYGLGSMLGVGAVGRGEGGGIALIEGEMEEEKEEKRKDPPDVTDMLELFRELRDIVEQIDYARAFMAMGGVHFLLGLATHRDYHRDCIVDDGEGDIRLPSPLPDSIRRAALGTISTMCQNNPPVQSCLLGCDHVSLLVRLFLDYARIPGNGNDDSRNREEEEEEEEERDLVRSDVVRALSASVREFPISERAFCEFGGVEVLGMGLGMTISERPLRLDGDDDDDDDDEEVLVTTRPTTWQRRPSVRLRKRSIFLLRALLTSDDADDDRHVRFRDVISFACIHLIDDEMEEDAEIREICLAMMTALLRRGRELPNADGGGGGGGSGGEGGPASNVILQHKDRIGSIGVRRIRAIRDLEAGSEDRESATLELEEWENLLVALAEVTSAKARNDCGRDDAPLLAVCDMYVP